MIFTPKFVMLKAKEGKEFAKKFTDKYGEIFSIMQIGLHQGKWPVVIVNTSKDETVVVEKRDDGIYILNKFFASAW